MGKKVKHFTYNLRNRNIRKGQARTKALGRSKIYSEFDSYSTANGLDTAFDTF